MFCQPDIKFSIQDLCQASLSLKIITDASSGIVCRYGEIFKTHLEGYQTVVTTSPEAYKFVMFKSAKELLPLYATALRLTMGPDFVNFLSGSVHSRVRSLHLGHLSSAEALKKKVGDIEKAALIFLEEWVPETMIPAFRFGIEDVSIRDANMDTCLSCF